MCYYQEMEDEIWRPLYGWESEYEASNLGRIRTARQKRNWPCGHVLALRASSAGFKKKPYTYVNIGATSKRLARLIATTFLGPPLSPQLQVNHIDGNTLNDHVVNLEWVTGSGNIRHAIDSGLAHPRFVSAINRPRGEQAGTAKLTENAVIFIRSHPEIRAVDLAAQFHVSRWAINSVRRVTGRSWSHIR